MPNAQAARSTIIYNQEASSCKLPQLSSHHTFFPKAPSQGRPISHQKPSESLGFLADNINFMFVFPAVRLVLLLARCSELFGKRHCMDMLTKPQPAFTLFSGVECAHVAWQCIEAAAAEMWGIRTGVSFTFMTPNSELNMFLISINCEFSVFRGMGLQVEENKQCQKLLKKQFADSCLFPDIMDLAQNKIPEKIISVSAVKIKSHSRCVSHSRVCPVPLGDGVRCTLGAPCVLFSKHLVIAQRLQA